MCKQCQQALNELFPEESQGVKEFIIWNLTSFPFGSPEHIRAQLEHVKEVVESIEEARAANAGDSPVSPLPTTRKYQTEKLCLTFRPFKR